MNQAIKLNSRLNLPFFYLRPTIEFSVFLCYNSDPSSLKNLWWNAVKTIISSIYNRFNAHATFALLNFLPAPTIFFEKVLRLLISVVCDRYLNLVIRDEHVSVCRIFSRKFNFDVTRGNDELTERLREFC